jgi:tetratricopeptide (TPR) repeat protein
MWLGDIARTAHQTAEATELLSLAFEAFTTAGHLVDSAIVLTQLGELYTQHGKVDEGHEKLAAAEQLVAGRDDKPSQHCLANIYRVLANSEVMRGGRNALKYLRRAQALFTETDDKQGQATTHRLHGQFAMHTGNEGSAFRHFTEARSLYTEVGDLIGQAHVAMFMGEMDLHHGTHTRGVALVTEAYRIYQRMGDPLGQGNTLHILGEEALRNGALNDAKSHIAQALKMHQAAGDDLATARDHVSLAELALEGGSRQQAREQLARAAKIYERQGYRPQSDRYTSIKNRIEAAR